jgi:hypothetical protein
MDNLDELSDQAKVIRNTLESLGETTDSASHAAAMRKLEKLEKQIEQVAEAKSVLQGRRLTIIGESSCFAAGTPILTPNGHKQIQNFRPGDKVLARNEHNPDGEVREQTIEEVFELQAEIVEVVVNDKTIETTAEHPFYVIDRGWVPVVELKEGDQLLGHSDAASRVHSIRFTDKIRPVFNIRVAQDHTYFVGADNWAFSVWVHNRYDVRKVGEDQYKIYDEVEKAYVKWPDGKERVFTTKGQKAFLENLVAPKSTFKLPTTWRSAGGVAGKFSDGKHSFRIDTHNLSPGERFHVHIYNARGKEIAVIQGRGTNGIWRESHAGQTLLKPSEVSSTLRIDIRRLLRNALNNIE